MERYTFFIWSVAIIIVIFIMFLFITPVEEVLLSFDVEPLNTEGEIRFILSTLDQYDAKATFFVTGDFAKNHSALTKELAWNYEVACHTMTHPRIPEINETQLRWELEECKRVIEDITNKTVRGFRAPYNLIDERTHALLPELGYDYDASGYEHLGWFYPPPTVKEVEISTLVFLPMQDYVLAHLLHLGDFGFFLMRLDKDKQISIDFHPHHIDNSRGAFQYLVGSYADDEVRFMTNAEAADEQYVAPDVLR
ncbi:polysaccharide deacetylase family protein [Candidatus Woesearchaeota archaeon]|nr:polysaccharide deacetylase family protein [Candidatus Woesearchaeota archaeon]